MVSFTGVPQLFATNAPVHDVEPEKNGGG